MDWSDLGKKVAGYADEIGGLLGPGGAVVGEFIASTFGIENDPDKIAQAIESDPDAALKLKELQQNHKAEMTRLAMQEKSRQLESETAQLAEVNKTMRAEIRNDVKWRVAFGYMMTMAVGLIVAGFVYLLVAKTSALADAAQGIQAIVPILQVALGVLGITAYNTHTERKAGMGQTQGAIEKAIKAMKS